VTCKPVDFVHGEFHLVVVVGYKDFGQLVFFLLDEGEGGDGGELRFLRIEE